MKKVYNAPIAKLIDYKYEEQVAASSIPCSGEIRIVQGAACNSVRMNEFSKSADPCYWDTDVQM